ncbi:Phosphate transporter PHO1-like protein 7 [Frankliniella fusca]|uniref:Phosphate transporter PHO1-like protein 7 n=1 Tax=Frankliniella fusca TaxID=407009 RepID=A0AAE1HH99_9NEOP|nr:Phosphate transporter PHO1-like protein 7 [Frankliniella fusca]
MPEELQHSDQTSKASIPCENNLKLLTLFLRTVSDDIFETIRDIVPPPPAAFGTCCVEESKSSFLECSSSLEESLYTRRPTEGSLLEKVRSTSNSVQEALINIEDVFFQLIDPKKYTDTNELIECISKLMQVYAEYSALQELGLQCLVRLSQQNEDFLPPNSVLNLILVTLEHFPTNTEIFRKGLKILMKKKIFKHLHCKIDIAKLVFNALCSMYGVDYFIVFAKNIVAELQPTEKHLIRENCQYIKMLLDFPHRQNETMTIILRWCALDVLLLLADQTQPWEALTSVDGHTKLQKLYQVPEFEDRCRFLLDIALPPHTHKEMGNSTFTCTTQEKLLQINEWNGKPCAPPQHFTSENGGEHCPEDKRKLETSASLSSALKTSDVCEQGVIGNETRKTYSTSGDRACNPAKKCINTVEASKKLIPRLPVKSNELQNCIICKEPKGKQTLLVKQFKQIAHCLHQPSNLLLFNCLEANICEYHRV